MLSDSRSRTLWTVALDSRVALALTGTADPEERTRVLAAGGAAVASAPDGVLLLNGSLEVSRGAGFVGEAGLGREPLVVHRVIAAGDKAALLLSSGVSAALSDSEIADLARLGPLAALKVTSRP
jgi:hypothetical protein